jgi:hypothetical protein
MNKKQFELTKLISHVFSKKISEYKTPPRSNPEFCITFVDSEGETKELNPFKNKDQCFDLILYYDLLVEIIDSEDRVIIWDAVENKTSVGFGENNYNCDLHTKTKEEALMLAVVSACAYYETAKKKKKG